jgi:twinkle protein
VTVSRPLAAKHKHDDSDSEYEFKTSCDFCGSKDNRAVYSDGHSFCFTCPEETAWQPPEGEERKAPANDAEPKPKKGLLSGTAEPIPSRKLDAKTVEKFRYLSGRHHGKPVQIEQWADASGRIVAQKLRDKDKNFTIIGDPDAALPLPGMHLWRDGGRMIVVTEGYIDAMSFSQSAGLRWPAVTLPNGAQSASKAIAKAADWLERYDRVVLMFDMDEAGREAAEKAAKLLTPGKVFIAELPLKDANEMVKAGRSDELYKAAWDARSYRPDGIIRVRDIKEAALEPPTYGLPYPIRGLTEATYGIRRGELIGWGAGVGVGKTTLFQQQILSTMKPELIADHSGLLLPPNALEPRRVGALLLETNARKQLRLLAGMALHKRLHVPGAEFDRDEVEATMDSMDPYWFSYDHFGAKDWEGIKDAIRYMVLGEGVRDVFLDHLTALIATAEDDRKALDMIMPELAGMVEQHQFTLHFISHLTTPTGTAHEEGGRVLEKHFTGSRAIARWSHNLFALERNKQNPDEPTTLRILKERETGDATGKTFGLGYNRDTGLFEEVDLEDGPFSDETMKEQDGDF